jgi:Flp pilus assembly protein TadD
MRIRFVLAAAIALAMVAPVLADARSDAKEQLTFGIELAQRNLWRDATIRFERAVQIDPTYAEAWNDLGIGYEQLGKLEDAREAYDKALKLAPTNQFIRNNNDQFREIYDRQGIRRRGR